MSAQAMGWALDQDLPARPKLVLVAVANHADHTDGYCWLKAETISAESSHSVRSVYRTLAALERNGFLRKQKRKGADGKQRANDYWILFDRVEAPFKWHAGLGADGDEDGELAETQDDAETHDSSGVDPLDVDSELSPSEQATSCGPSDSLGTRQAESKQAVSCGPTAIGVTAKDSAEPSKTNPENVGLRNSKPRTYRPPPAAPPQPMGSTTLEGTGKLIFVFKPSPAYDAWKAFKERETGRPFNCADWSKGRSGWWFPTLYPPEKPPPVETSLATEEDLNEFAQTGVTG